MNIKVMNESENYLKLFKNEEIHYKKQTLKICK